MKKRKSQAAKAPSFGAAKYQESKHPRGPGGKFAAKPGGPEKKPRETVGARHLKSTGVSGEDKIVVSSARVKIYAGHDSVESFVKSHPKGQAFALRTLAADHKAGRIKFQGKVTADHIVVPAKAPKGAKSAKPKTVAEHIGEHPKGKIAGAKKLAAEHKAGKVKFEKPAAVKTPKTVAARAPKGPPTDAEKKELIFYSQKGYRSINAGLRSRSVQPYLKGSIEKIDAAISKSSLATATTLYRGMNEEDVRNMLAKAGGEFKKGMIISDPAFISTSKSRSQASGFIGAGGPGALTISIKAPAESQALDMAGFSAQLHDEKEVLLPRETKMRVVSFKPGTLVVELVT